MHLNNVTCMHVENRVLGDNLESGYLGVLMYKAGQNLYSATRNECQLTTFSHFWVYLTNCLVYDYIIKVS